MVEKKYLTLRDESRFWILSGKSGLGIDDCWLWRGTKFHNGYGVFKALGKVWRAHRIAYQIIHGPIPENAKIRHTCGNKDCVNPRHLYLDEGPINRPDISKLTTRKVRNIRTKYANGETMNELARKYGVYPSTIKQIIDGVTWKEETKNKDI